PVVYPLIGLCLVWGFYLFFRYRGFHMLSQLLHQKRFPIFEMTVAVLTIAFSPIAEKDYLHIFGVRCELMEEILELISYLGLFITQLDIFMETRRKENN
ncbi:MAG TPA: hypothetical protein DDW50_10540, partial [Firmicutes bacterium]|nr:hypothetical protein [Bacillota bacterium]